MAEAQHPQPRIVLIRHAQSVWNRENRFSGWADPLLTDEGQNEAIKAARLLKQHNLHFDLAFCSYLQRTRQTLDIMLRELQQQEIEIKEDWRLNERHYGVLQGTIKTPEAHNTTADQIWRWRRSYRDKAEPLALDDPRHPANDERYQNIERTRLPAVENLEETRSRVSEFWHEEVEPAHAAQRSILISAHGNSLRALLMELAQLTIAEVEAFEIPTGTPIVLEAPALSGGPWHWGYLE